MALEGCADGYGHKGPNSMALHGPPFSRPQRDDTFPFFPPALAPLQTVGQAPQSLYTCAQRLGQANNSIKTGDTPTNHITGTLTFH